MKNQNLFDLIFDFYCDKTILKKMTILSIYNSLSINDKIDIENEWTSTVPETTYPVFGIDNIYLDEECVDEIFFDMYSNRCQLIDNKGIYIGDEMYIDIEKGIVTEDEFYK